MHKRALCSYLSGTFVTKRLVRHPSTQSVPVRPCTQVGILPFHSLCFHSDYPQRGPQHLCFGVTARIPKITLDGRYPLPCCLDKPSVCSDFPHACACIRATAQHEQSNYTIIYEYVNSSTQTRYITAILLASGAYRQAHALRQYTHMVLVLHHSVCTHRVDIVRSHLLKPIRSYLDMQSVFSLPYDFSTQGARAPFVQLFRWWYLLSQGTDMHHDPSPLQVSRRL